MHNAKLLPSYLIQRYHGWKATAYAENRAWYRRLAESGQHPRAMVISCCDSRVHVTSIFGADEGEFFIHRYRQPCAALYARWQESRHLGGGGICRYGAESGACGGAGAF